MGSKSEKIAKEGAQASPSSATNVLALRRDGKAAQKQANLRRKND